MTSQIAMIDMTAIIPGDNGTGQQDRTVFDPASLAELAGSIKEHGLLQPIMLRPVLSFSCEHSIIPNTKEFTLLWNILHDHQLKSSATQPDSSTERAASTTSTRATDSARPSPSLKEMTVKHLPAGSRHNGALVQSTPNASNFATPNISVGIGQSMQSESLNISSLLVCPICGLSPTTPSEPSNIYDLTLSQDDVTSGLRLKINTYEIIGDQPMTTLPLHSTELQAESAIGASNSISTSLQKGLPVTGQTAIPNFLHPTYTSLIVQSESVSANLPKPFDPNAIDWDFLGVKARYQLVYGERRFRACEMLGWLEIPAIVSDVTADEAAALMLAENTSRKDLDAIDEGRAYQVRIDRLGWTVADCAKSAGVSEVRVQFRIKLLKLRTDLQDMIRTGNLPLGYAQILAGANLDTNRQMIAIRQLRDNPTPTPAWFRRIVNELLTQQAQGSMFDDMPLFGGETVEAPKTATHNAPPTPATAQPPVKGRTPKEIVSNQMSFWQQAAESWERMGKPFKRQECQAAAQALGFVFATL